MAKRRNLTRSDRGRPRRAAYRGILTGVVDLLDFARHTAARSINAIMTAVYWEIGRRIVEFEQQGEEQADYGAVVVARLASDLSSRFGRGFGKSNLYQMRAFYLAYREIFQTASGKLARQKNAIEIFQTASGKLAADQDGELVLNISGQPHITLSNLAERFPLPWSHYVLLIKVENIDARMFYETEALYGGWTVRQLDRQITTFFFERTLASRKKGAMLRKGASARDSDALTVEEEIKDPFVLEFLGLKDEYSESDLEEAMIRDLENFLLELGTDFAFVGRQKRLRIGNDWFRIDLIFFHRRLKSLFVIDLKLGKFTHADAGQMHLYLNYARKNWMNENENPPVGVILCTQKDEAVAHYSLEGLQNKILAAEYRTALPNEKMLVAELKKRRRLLESRIAFK